MTLLPSLGRLLAPVLLSSSLLVSLAPPGLTQGRLYNPIPLPDNKEVTDTLTDEDIPTGQGGFARDYTVELQAGDQVVIDLTSDSFDTVVMLMGEAGMSLGENDDGSDGSTNSMLFTRIDTSGTYTVRVRSFGEGSGGQFTLKVTRLRPV
jgi:hypothetical protein